MAEKLKFTEAAIKRLPIPYKATAYKDYDNPSSTYRHSITGLQLVVYPSGVKSFVLRKKLSGQSKAITLGRHPDMTVEAARKKAQQYIQAINEGVDPTHQKRIDRNLTLEQCFNDYISDRTLSPNTLSNYTTIVEKRIHDWKRKPLSSISRELVQKKHREISIDSETSANKTMRLVRAVFNYASEEYLDTRGRSLFPENPVNQLKHKNLWHKEKRRKTPLKGMELAIWYSALQKLEGEGLVDTVKDLLIFILFTGLRRREASELRWENVDLKNKHFYISNTKNQEDFYLPLTKTTYKLLSERRKKAESEYVFEGSIENRPIQEPKRQITKLKAASGTDFTIHHLRGTFLTVAATVVENSYLLKALTNHKPPSNDVTAGYINLDVEALRNPAQRIETEIIKIIRKKDEQ